MKNEGYVPHVDNLDNVISCLGHKIEESDTSSILHLLTATLFVTFVYHKQDMVIFKILQWGREMGVKDDDVLSALCHVLDEVKAEEGVKQLFAEILKESFPLAN